MTPKNDSTAPPMHSASLGKSLLLGAAIALVLITIFLLQVKEPNPDWPKFWMIRPLIVVPFAGAMGGLCYYLLDNLRYQGGWKKIAANVLSVVVYLFGLWMGFVLGLDGTLWN